MIAFRIAVLLIVASLGTAVVFTRDVRHQPVGVGAFGLMLAVMFMTFQAPDVALSQLVIGAVGLPLMILLTLSILRRDAEGSAEASKDQEQRS